MRESVTNYEYETRRLLFKTQCLVQMNKEELETLLNVAIDELVCLRGKTEQLETMIAQLQADNNQLRSELEALSTRINKECSSA